MQLRDAAEMLGVHYQTAYAWVRQGVLPARKTGRGYEVSEGDVSALAARRASGTAPRPHIRVRDWTAQADRLHAAIMAGDETMARHVFARLARGVPLTDLCSRISPRRCGGSATNSAPYPGATAGYYGAPCYDCGNEWGNEGAADETPGGFNLSLFANNPEWYNPGMPPPYNPPTPVNQTNLTVRAGTDCDDASCRLCGLYTGRGFLLVREYLVQRGVRPQR